MLAASGTFSLDWWMAVTSIIVSMGTIFFFLRRVVIKNISTDIKKDIADLKSDVTPNGKNTQKLGDITARTETKVDGLTTLVQQLAVNLKQVNDALVEHIGWHKGQGDL